MSRHALLKQRHSYRKRLEALQTALVGMQYSFGESGARVLVLFEGRDAAGKSGAIRRVTEHLNPRAMRIVALPIANEEERSSWYLKRYIREFPRAGEIVFFDRSWYNRAIVEPVNDLCTPDEYALFMAEVPIFEALLVQDGMTLIKLWFELDKQEQADRIASRLADPIKQWKVTTIDLEAQDKWDAYTQYEDAMFAATDTARAPWVRIDANDKRAARLAAMQAILDGVRVVKQAPPLRQHPREPVQSASLPGKVPVPSLVLPVLKAEAPNTLHALVDPAVPALTSALAAALQDVLSPAARAALATALSTGDLVTAHRIIEHAWMTTGVSAVRGVLEAVMTQIAFAAADQMATAPRLAFTFDRVDPFVVQAIRESAATAVTEIDTATRAALQGILERGSAAGTPLGTQVKEISALVGLTERQALSVQNYRAMLHDEAVAPTRIDTQIGERIAQLKTQRAETIARHEAMRAANRGRQAAWGQAVRAGLLKPDEWLRFLIVTDDDRLCELCRDAEDQNSAGVGLEEPFETLDGFQYMPPFHVTCLTGDALITSGGRIAASSKRWYDGEVVVLYTSCKKQLTCTPNHPILTPSGWVPAGFLMKGCDIICSSGQQGILHADMGRNDMPATLQEIAEAFRLTARCVPAVVPVSSEDFHGDGMGSNVTIIRANSLLRDERYPSLCEPCYEHLLGSRPLPSSLVRAGGAAALFPGLRASTVSRMDRHGASLSLSQRQLLPLENFGLMMASRHNATLQQPAADNRTRNLQLLSQRFLRCATEVAVDQVIKVERSPFHGYVYNLQTELQWYSANTILTHNCRCTMTLRMKGA